MARIELRDVTIYIQDGLSGNAVLSSNGTANDATINLSSIVLNTTDTDLVPIGARLYLDGETVNTVHTVTARDPASTSPTTCVTITPVLGAGSYNSGNSENAVTFINQRLQITIGEGNLTFTESKEYEYLRDRGNLDTVKEGDEQPVSVELEFEFEYIWSESGQDVTPVEAIKGVNNASEWVSSATDLCEPYAVDILLKHCVPCGTDQDQDILLPDFRWESLDYDFDAATIAVSGQCNVSAASVTRSTDTEC
jgi:hypothetical protein